ncbi:MAG: type I glyceraldehyde-3-phosphate dehydrogenase, partial [Patescibacteria group bacterium]
ENLSDGSKNAVSAKKEPTMKRLKVGINGFGRIGRAFTRIALLRDAFDIVAINTRKTPNDMMAYLLQHDSVYHKFNATVTEEKDGIKVNNNFIATLQNADIETIPWNKYDVDIVVDATGAFNTTPDLMKHIKGSVKRVILTAPSKDEETPHVVLGVNDDTFDWEKNQVISNASCTTNCSAPMFKVINDNLKVISGFLTTAHAYTLTQSLLDDTASSIDKARSATLNISPSTTGAAKAVARTIPDLKGKIDGMAIRVPVPTVSFTDISAVVEKPTTIEEVNNMFRRASEVDMKGFLDYSTAHMVSSDYIGSPYSCIFDANYTKVINGTFIKIFGWYDNEWGYSTRLVDLVEKVGNYI